MHRAFAAWLTGKSWRPPLFAAIFGVLSPQGMSPIAVLAGGIPVLLLLAGGPSAGLQATVAGAAAVSAFLIANEQSWLIAGVSVAVLFLAPFGLALLLQRTGSLSLCVQVAVLGAGLILIALYLGLADPVGSWQTLLRDAAKQVARSGLIGDEDLILKSLAGSNWGTYVALGLLTLLGSLFIGGWWHSLLQASGVFGKEFQQLRLGKILGTLTLSVVILALVLRMLDVSVPILDALVWVAATGLMLQGIAAVHRIHGLGGTSRRIALTAMYVLLIVELKLMAAVLAVWGVIDSWRRRPSAA